MISPKLINRCFGTIDWVVVFSCISHRFCWELITIKYSGLRQIWLGLMDPKAEDTLFSYSLARAAVLYMSHMLLEPESYGNMFPWWWQRCWRTSNHISSYPRNLHTVFSDQILLPKASWLLDKAQGQGDQMCPLPLTRPG